jgi:hypothetical protein
VRYGVTGCAEYPHFLVSWTNGVLDQHVLTSAPRLPHSSARFLEK